MPGAVEKEVADLLAQTREVNQHYSSSSYDDGPGLGRRLQAIEDALLRLARAIDEAQT